jgi:hypothetical protein
MKEILTDNGQSKEITPGQTAWIYEGAIIYLFGNTKRHLIVSVGFEAEFIRQEGNLYFFIITNVATVFNSDQSSTQSLNPGISFAVAKTAFKKLA